MLDEGLGRLEFDRSGRITHASAAMVELLGPQTTPATSGLTGLPLEVLSGLSPLAWERLLDVAPPGPSVDFVWSSLPDGGRRCVRVELVRGEDGGGRVCALDLTAALVDAPPVQLSPLSSALSHELRNPLSSVKMAVQTLARNDGLSERDQRRLAIANREIRTLERMLWLLSEYGRLGAPNLEPLPLGALLEESHQLVAPELTERGVQFTLEPAAAEQAIRADRARTRVVLAQVILGVALGTAGPHTLTLSLHARTATHTVVALVDRAARLAEGDAEEAFRPFASPLARGAGLSLATLQTVLRVQGGAVSLVDLGGDGVSYLLHFPNA